MAEQEEVEEEEEEEEEGERNQSRLCSVQPLPLLPTDIHFVKQVFAFISFIKSSKGKNWNADIMRFQCQLEECPLV